MEIINIDQLILMLQSSDNNDTKLAIDIITNNLEYIPYEQLRNCYMKSKDNRKEIGILLSKKANNENK
jgi:hypothetical protein